METTPHKDGRFARLRHLFGRAWARPDPSPPVRDPLIHLIILDGTMSSLEPGEETNAGLTYRLAQQMGEGVLVYYEPGLQWTDWRSIPDVASGRGLNGQIKRAYGHLASRYRPGDRIFLMGYSRGAFAVRSLAGIIERMGLLERGKANEQNIRRIYHLYECDALGEAAQSFRQENCYDEVPIEMIGVWDTVKSLGVNAPVLWRLSVARYAFHNLELSPLVKYGRHALAMDETRVVYRPVLWEADPDDPNRIIQMWFRGSHGDVGGQLSGRHYARHLSNIPLVWMLEQAEEAGLPLPEGWARQFPQNVNAPSVGTWVGWSKIFVTRRKRPVGLDPSERVHDSVDARAADWSQVIDATGT